MATRIVRTSPISACSASNTVRSNHQGGLGRRHRGPTSAPRRGGASGESCHFGTTTSRLGSAAECQSFLRLLYWCAPDPELGRNVDALTEKFVNEHLGLAALP